MISGCLMVGFVGCIDLDDKKETSYYEAMVNVTAGGIPPTFETDEGVVFNPVNLSSSDASLSFETGDRLYILFSFYDTTNHAANRYSINLEGYLNVQIADFKEVDADSADRFANNPLYNVYRIGITKNYLNVIVDAYHSDDADQLKLVRYKKNEPSNQVDTMPTIYFEVRHDVESASLNTYNSEAWSYRLEPLLDEFPRAKSFKLSVTLYSMTGGQKTFDLTYKPETEAFEEAPMINRPFQLLSGQRAPIFRMPVFK
jgi:hypothetical protein